MTNNIFKLFNVQYIGMQKHSKLFKMLIDKMFIHSHSRLRHENVHLQMLLTE